ncbi:MAG: PhnD/SsuA/transferrin family substrate-binding protein [Pseudomonadota bacterium]
MIASLPMYDRPETHDQTDAFWRAIRDRLRARELAAPDALTRSGDPWADWLDPDLVFSQSCSLPYRAKLHGRVSVIAAPEYGIDCPAGHTYSVIVAAREALHDSPRLAINDGLSQSGWAAAYDWIRARGIEPASILASGSHIASARAITEGRADFAAIDAQSWHFLRRYDAFAADLVVLDATPPKPMLPYITRQDLPAQAMAQALFAAVESLSAATKEALNLRGIAEVDPAAYLAMGQPPAPQDVAELR